MTLKEWLEKENMTMYRLAKTLGESNTRVRNTVMGTEPRGTYRQKLRELTRGEVDFFR